MQAILNAFIIAVLFSVLAHVKQFLSNPITLLFDFGYCYLAATKWLRGICVVVRNESMA